MVFCLLLLLPITILVIIILPRFLTTSASSKKPLPPGPKPWPIVGNLPHLEKAKLHVSLRNLSNSYGPLMSLRLGSQLLVVASSPAAAAEILRTHDRLLCARSVPRVLPYDVAELDRKTIVWASHCGDQWKAFRAMFRNQMVSPTGMESQAAVREKKVAEMVEFLAGKLGDSIGIGEVAFAAIFDSLSNLIFSRDCIGFERNDIAYRLKSTFRKFMDLGFSPNLADFFPILKNLDLQGLRREALRCSKQLYSIWAPYVKERREERRRKQDPAEARDFLDIFLKNGLDDDQIDWLILELFVGGTDTSVTTIEWAMTELIRNRGAMDKLREELNRELLPPGNLLMDESAVAQLPYLNAIVKETLRLHLPGPLLLPHRATESCEVMNYTIPKGAQIVVNAWAIARDPTVWEDDPTSFKPERFLGSNTVDFRGQDFELLPFSAGRRMCPGVTMASRQISLVLAALVRNFDWCLPNGEDPSDLNMTEKFGITLQKAWPLVLVSSRSSL